MDGAQASTQLDGFTDWLIDENWLVNWLIDKFVDCLIDQVVDHTGLVVAGLHMDGALASTHLDG